MNPRVTQKDTTIGDRQYRLTKMDPRLACWLFSVLAGKSTNDGQLLSSLGQCSRELFDEIQGQALKFVFFLDTKDGNTFPIPVVAPNGLFTDKILEGDPSEVFKLTAESIMFNVEPFVGASKSTDQP